LHKKMGVPQGRSKGVQKISPPPPLGFDIRTVQHVASCYSAYIFMSSLQST
jgi:hypothetical protein